MTKEMKPSHRIDVLTDALTYYARKTISNIGWLQCTSLAHGNYMYTTIILHCTDTILVKRIQRVKLQELMTASPGTVRCMSMHIIVAIIMCTLNNSIHVQSITIEHIEMWLEDETSHHSTNSTGMST